MKHYINRKTIENNELLPSASYLQDWITHEVDTGNVFMSDGTDILLVHGAEKNEVLKNKELHVLENNFIDTQGVIDDPFLSDIEIKGGVIPATTIPNSFYGILESNVTLLNPNAVRTNALNVDFASVKLEFRTGDPDAAMGFVSLNPYFRRDMGFEVKTIINSITRELFFGFSVSNVLNLTNSGIFIGFTENTPKFTVFSSNGLSSPQQIEFTAIPKDVFEHTFEIILKSDRVVCTIDDTQTINVTTKIPTLTDQLYLHCYGIV